MPCLECARTGLGYRHVRRGIGSSTHHSTLWLTAFQACAPTPFARASLTARGTRVRRSCRHILPCLECARTGLGYHHVRRGISSSTHHSTLWLTAFEACAPTPLARAPVTARGTRVRRWGRLILPCLECARTGLGYRHVRRGISSSTHHSTLWCPDFQACEPTPFARSPVTARGKRVRRW